MGRGISFAYAAGLRIAQAKAQSRSRRSWNLRPGGRGRFSHQIFAGASQEPCQQRSNALKQHSVLGSERVLVRTLDVQRSHLSTCNLHGNDDLFARARIGHLIRPRFDRMIEERRHRPSMQCQINSYPTIVPALTQQAGHVLQWGMVERWFRSECALNVSNDGGSGTIGFHGSHSLIPAPDAVNELERRASQAQNSLVSRASFPIGPV